MTVTLDIAPHIFEQVQAEARAQNRQPADLISEAIADRWSDDSDAGEDENDLYRTHPLPALLTRPMTEAAREVDADIAAGRVHDGADVLAEIRALAFSREHESGRK